MLCLSTLDAQDTEVELRALAGGDCRTPLTDSQGPLAPHQIRDLLDGRFSVGLHLDEFEWWTRLAATAAKGVMPNRAAVSDGGWCIVFSDSLEPEAREAFRPLIELRKRQLEPRGESVVVREFHAGSRFCASESTRCFLERNCRGGKSRIERRLPQNILIVGSPTDVPYHIQYELGVQHSVGRLFFEDPGNYGHYVGSLIEVEELQSNEVPRRVGIFGPSHPGNQASLLGTKFAEQLAGEVRGLSTDWGVEACLAANASKEGFRSMAGGESPPRLFLSLGHSAVFGPRHPLQRDLQGALLCSKKSRETEGLCLEDQRQDIVTPEDIPSNGRLLGHIGIYSSCFSAGVPRWDEFFWNSGGKPIEQAAKAFIGATPQALLGRANGTASAIIAHVDKTWELSLELLPRTIRATYRNLIWNLMSGAPVGHAVRRFHKLHATLARLFVSELDNARAGTRCDAMHLTRLWKLLIETRGYILLGDPLARLNHTASQAKLCNEKRSPQSCRKP